MRHVAWCGFVSFVVSFKKHDITDIDTERSIPIGLLHRRIIALLVLRDSRSLFLAHITFYQKYHRPAYFNFFSVA